MGSEDGANVGAALEGSALEAQGLQQVSHLAGTGGDMGVASDIGGGVCVEAAELRGQLYGNLALSFLKLGQPEKALEMTTQVVQRVCLSFLSVFVQTSFQTFLSAYAWLCVLECVVCGACLACAA